MIIKDALRSEHPLLATNLQTKPLILRKLLKSIDLTEDEEKEQKTVEFDEALKRLCAFINANQISKEYHFIKEHYAFLNGLNILRNRLLHRGTFVLRYEALDMLMIQYAIPLIKEVNRRKTFALKMIPFNWKFKPVHCKVNPFDEMPRCVSSNGYMKKKVALFKELIRAAYCNPIELEHDYKALLDPLLYTEEHSNVPKGSGIQNKRVIQTAEFSAQEILKDSSEWNYGNYIQGVTKCPVCGVDSLVVYYDRDDKNHDIIFIDKVKCTCCTFQISHHLDILDDATLGIENFWARSHP